MLNIAKSTIAKCIQKKLNSFTPSNDKYYNFEEKNVFINFNQQYNKCQENKLALRFAWEKNK